MWLRFIWEVEKCLNADTSEYLLFRHRKLFDYMYSIIFHIVDLKWFSKKPSNIGKSLRSGAGCSFNRNRCVLSCVISCAFYPSVSVGSSAAEWMSLPLFHLGRMENNVNPKSLTFSFCFCSIYCYNSLLLIDFMFVSSGLNFGVKTSGRMFSYVVQIQLNTSLYSQLTALQRAQISIADFRSKTTGIF